MSKKWNVELADELHRQAPRKYPHRKVMSPSLDRIWGIDLLQLDRLSCANRGFRYILVCVDLFSRFAWLRALKRKSEVETTLALRDVFKEATPKKAIWCDLGKEFLNKSIKALLQENKIILYHTYGPQKSCYAERLVRSLKLTLWKHFTITDKNNWIDYLQELNTNYNNKKHRSIGISPSEARLAENNFLVMTRNLKKSKSNIPKKSFVYRVGDRVRVSKTRGVFYKSYKAQYSQEIFEIHRVNDTEPVTYILSDMSNNIIKGSFYAQELLKTSQSIFYYKILKRRTVNGVKQYFVHWRDYSEDQNSWINASSEVIKSVKKLVKKNPTKNIKKSSPNAKNGTRKSERLRAKTKSV